MFRSSTQSCSSFIHLLPLSPRCHIVFGIFGRLPRLAGSFMAPRFSLRGTISILHRTECFPRRGLFWVPRLIRFC